MGNQCREIDEAFEEGAGPDVDLDNDEVRAPSLGDELFDASDRAARDIAHLAAEELLDAGLPKRVVVRGRCVHRGRRHEEPGI